MNVNVSDCNQEVEVSVVFIHIACVVCFTSEELCSFGLCASCFHADVCISGGCSVRGDCLIGAVLFNVKLLSLMFGVGVVVIDKVVVVAFSKDRAVGVNPFIGGCVFNGDITAAFHHKVDVDVKVQ